MRRDMLCAKHKAQWDDYADRGPWRPLPAGMTYAQARSQMVVIEKICRSGTSCERIVPDGTTESLGIKS